MPFPADFVWGAAAASYQIEGSTEGVDGCGESVWDMCCKRDGFVKGGDTGYVACDHYNRYQEDVALMKTIGLKAYRLSVMWPRVMPEGTGAVNQQGLDFYDKLVDELLNAGVTPWATLFHWDYPVALFNRGGWLNEDSPKWFEDYARVVVDKLSDRIANWFTLNEPCCFIALGHQSGIHAPGLQLNDRQVHRAWYHSLLAHGRGVKAIREGSKIPNPKVGAAPTFRTTIPASESEADIKAARDEMFALAGTELWRSPWSLDPVFKGIYPEGFEEALGDAAPAITDEGLQLINQDLDFLGLNVYQGAVIRATEDCGREVVEARNDQPHTGFDWPITPEALRWAATFLHERYQKPIIITENGLSMDDWVSTDGKCHDPNRIDFLKRHLRGLEKAIDEGVDVAGYFQWSIMDNFEWAAGYHERFGIIHVNYKTQERTIKDSGHWYADVIKTNGAILAEGGDKELY